MTKGNDSKEFFEVFKPKQPENIEDTQKREVKPLKQPPDGEPQSTPPITENKAVTATPAAADPLAWIRNTQKENTAFKEKLEAPKTPRPVSDLPKSERIQRKDEVILRQETLIIGAIAATFLSIACFFVGHKVGYNKGTLKQAEEWQETIESSDIKKTGFVQSRTEEVPQKNIVKPASEKPAAKPVPEKPIVKPAPEKQAEQPVVKDKWTLRAVTYSNTKENIEKAKEIARTLQDKLNYNAFVVNTGKDIFVCVGEFEASDSSDIMKAKSRLSELSYENRKQFEGCYPVRIK